MAETEYIVDPFPDDCHRIAAGDVASALAVAQQFAQGVPEDQECGSIDPGVTAAR
jgi:hypothetical protein